MKPQQAGATAGHLCVVLHDVAPSRWAACRRVMDAVQAVATEEGVAVPLSLLVVPTMHGQPASRPFVRWLHRQTAQGHEVVLHGWTHRDEVPLSGGWRDAWLRRLYTAGEGEFAALSYEQAWSRLALGRAWMAGQGLSASGFVAPAWLMSEASWRAVAAAGFRYTCTLTTVVALPQRQALHSRSLVFSTRSAGRRTLSIAWNRLQSVVQQRRPLLRLELHPCDADFPGVLQCWTQLLRQALRQRRAVTLAQACDRWWPRDELREPSDVDRPAGPVAPQGL